MSACQSLIRELDEAIQCGTEEKRVETLRRVTDLFIRDADRLQDEQIAVFDDVLGHLTEWIETRTLAELSGRLAPVDNAPIELMRKLASDNQITVAGPILTQSSRLTSADLIEIAKTKAQPHLLAISGRAQLDTTVTDVLLDRGDNKVLHRLADNSGARFSHAGFATLVQRSESDEILAETVGLRVDVPQALFRRLLEHATETVRARLSASAHPNAREEVERVLASIASKVDKEKSTQNESDVAAARRLVMKMEQKGELTEDALLDFAKKNQYAEMIAALALMCSTPSELIERLIRSEQREVFLIPCKVAGFDWSTVRAILQCRSVGQAMSALDSDQVKADYSRLTKENAQRVLRFWRVREAAAKPARASGAMPAGRVGAKI